MQALGPKDQNKLYEPIKELDLMLTQVCSCSCPSENLWPIWQFSELSLEEPDFFQGMENLEPLK